MIRVVIADDHAIVREGLKQLLGSKDGIEVVGEAGDGTQVMERVRDTEFDVLVLDMSMPGRSGVELIKSIKAGRPRLTILVLSMYNEEQYAVRAVRAGAAGYLTKENAADRLVEAIKHVAQGRLHVSMSVAERLVMDGWKKISETPHTQLSDREYQVFDLLVDGRTVTEIAHGLCVSAKTVSTHKTRILQKMGAGSIADLVHYAIQHGLKPPRVG